jgi:hypothetical protein
MKVSFWVSTITSTEIAKLMFAIRFNYSQRVVHIHLRAHSKANTSSSWVSARAQFMQEEFLLHVPLPTPENSNGVVCAIESVHLVSARAPATQLPRP